MKRKIKRGVSPLAAASTKYPHTERLSSSKWQSDYSVKYACYESPVGDEEEGLLVMKNFQGQVSIIAPYDDADYCWATFANGLVKICQNGKVVDKMYYMDPDTWDMSNSEWYKTVIDEIVDALDEKNRKIESRMVHMSTKISKRKRVVADSEDTEDYEELPQVEQEYDSAKTSINSTKLPAIYRMISLPAGSVGVDYGGGKFDNAVEALAEQDVILHVYDPYNRSREHNSQVIKALRANGGADFAINSNVLNVIKEPEARLNVLQNIKKITKPGAPIYITVYEGSGKSDEGETSSGYQLNRKTAGYLDEIRQVFPDAKRKGKLIVASNSDSANSSTRVSATIQDDRWSCAELRQQLKYELCQIMKNQLGFEEDEVDGYSRVDVYFSDDRVVVEIGCEVGYEVLMEICNQLNPIIQECDPDSYFEPADPGIIVAYLNRNDCEEYVESCTSINDEVYGYSEYWLDPPEDDDYEEVTDNTTLYIPFDTTITVDQDGDYEYDEGYDFANSSEKDKTWYSDEYHVRIGDGGDIIEYIDDMLITRIPAEPGQYHIKGEVQLYFEVENIQVKRDYFWDGRHGSDYDEEAYADDAEVYFNKDASSVENFEIEKLN